MDEAEDNSDGFNIHDLKDMYLDFFGPTLASKLVEMSYVLSKTCLKKCQTMKSKIRRHDSFVKNLFQSYSVSFYQSSKSWMEPIRAVIQPIREDIFKRKNLFNCNLNSKNQDESLSPFPLALMSMLIDGKVNFEGKCSQAVLTLSAMVTYNTRKLKKSTYALNHRHHKRERETPVTTHVDLKLYLTVRSKTIIDHLFHLKILTSYDRVLSITKSLYEVLRRNYVQRNIFLQTNLKKECFVVLAKDNIDKNASSNLAKSHYRGTSISLLPFPEWKKVIPIARRIHRSPKIYHYQQIFIHPFVHTTSLTYKTFLN